MPQLGTKPELVSSTSFCQNFPRELTGEITRTNILHTLELMFEGDAELAVVHGPEGIGRTTLLAQFARQHCDRTLCIFLRPTSRFGYDPDLVMREMCLQAQCMLRIPELPTSPDNYSTLSRLINDLQRSCSRDKKFYYVVLDGIAEIPREDSHFKEQILSILPIGLTQFRFICSSPTDSIEPRRFEKLGNRRFRCHPSHWERRLHFWAARARLRCNGRGSTRQQRESRGS